MDMDSGEGGGHALQPVILRLRDRLVAELEETENSKAFRDATADQRMKTLTGFFKALQGVEDMINRMERESELDEKRGIDVVEFRRQLEEHIARLVEQEGAKPVSGGVE
ncbi:MAG: hypothetical protein AAFN43_01995 [Pseudomonadota bacterium]